MRLFWRKAHGDIAAYPARAVLLFLAIFIGTAVLSAALIGRTILTREIAASFERAAPPHIVIGLNGVSVETLALMRAQIGVMAVEPRRVLRGRVETQPGVWQSLRVTILPKDAGMTVSRLALQEGAAPSGASVLIERSSLPILGEPLGRSVAIRLPSGLSARMTVSGTAADGAVAPGWQDRIVYAYAAPEALDAWRIDGGFDELHILLDAGADVQATAKALRAVLDGNGIAITRVETPARLHPHADQMTAVLILISAFAMFGLIVSATLAATLTLATLTREIRQIGVMKAIGGSDRRITVLYVGTTGLIATVAAGCGLLPGWLAGEAFARYVAGELNLVDVNLSSGGATLAIALLLGFGAPVLTTAFVARKTLALSVREALQGHHDPRPGAPVGLTAPARSPILATILRGLTRSRARLAFTLIALAGGARH